MAQAKPDSEQVPAVQREGWPQPQRSLRRDGWALERSGVLALVEKLRRSGMPLEEYVGGRFYRGVVTGLNEAFVIDQATRDRLITEDPRSVEIVKPWLRGRDIKRWKIEPPGLYLLCVPWELPIEEYPAVYDHLQKHKKRLAARPEVKEGRFPWYAMSRYASEFASEFEEPKILYQEIATHQAFAFTEEPFYLNNKCFMIPTTDLCLLALLNSKVGWFILGHIVSKLQGGAYMMQSPYVSQFPVPTATPAQRAAIESLVRKLLDAEGQGPQVAEWERELNALVYEVYGLTEEEIGVVEGHLNHE